MINAYSNVNIKLYSIIALFILVYVSYTYTYTIYYFINNFFF